MSQEGFFKIPTALMREIVSLPRPEMLIVLHLAEFEGRWTAIAVEEITQCSTAKAREALTNLERRGLVVSRTTPAGPEYAIDVRGLK